MAEEIVRIIRIDPGNSSRSLKDLKNEIKSLQKELDGAKVGSSEFESALLKLAQTQKEYNTIQQQIRDSSRTNQQEFVRYASFARNLGKSYSALNAAIGLFSNGNEDIQKQMLKVQRTIQLMQGIDGIAGLVRDLPKVANGFKNWLRNLDPVERQVSRIAAGINGINPKTLQSINEYNRNAGNVSASLSASASSSSSGVVNQINTATQAIQEQGKTIVPVNDQWDKYTNELKAAQEAMREWSPEMSRLSDIFEEYNKHTAYAPVNMEAFNKAVNELLNGDPSKLHSFFEEIILDEDALNETAKAFGWTNKQLTEGLKNLEEGLGDDSAAIKQIKADIDTVTKATEASVSGFKKLKTTLKSVFSTVGWTLVITALVTAALKLTEYISKLREAAKEQRELNKAISQGTNQIASKQLVVLKELSYAYAKVGDTAKDKQMFVEQYADKIKETGIAIDDVKTAEDVFVNNTDKYVSAIMARAKAQAVEQQAIKIYEDYLNEVSRLEEGLGKLPAGGEQSIAGVIGTGYQTEKDIELQRELRDKLIAENDKKVQMSIDKATVEVNKKLLKMFTDIADLEKESGILGGEVKVKLTPEIATEETSADIQKLIEYYEKALEVINESGDNEFDEINRRYAEQIELAKKYGLDTLQLEEAREKELADLRKKYDDEAIEKEKERVEKELAEIQTEIDRIRRMNDTSNLREPREQTFQTTYRQPPITWSLGLGKTWQSVYQSRDDVNEQYKAQVEYNDRLYLLTKSRIEQENALLNEQLKIEGITADRRFEIQRTLAENQMALSDATLENEQSNLQAYLDYQEKRREALNGVLDTTSSLTGAIATMFRIESQNEKKSQEQRESALKAYKAFAITQAIADTYKGANEAYTAMASIPYVGPALGIAAAAAAIAGGIANVKSIISEQISTSNAYGDAAVNAPTSMATPPIEYTRNLLGDKELDELNKPIKCYVLENDITSTQNKVKVAEDNASF